MFFFNYLTTVLASWASRCAYLAINLCSSSSLELSRLLRVERPSMEPESNGAMKFGSGKPLCDGRGDGGLNEKIKIKQAFSIIKRTEK